MHSVSLEKAGERKRSMNPKKGLKSAALKARAEQGRSMEAEARRRYRHNIVKTETKPYARQGKKLSGEPKREKESRKQAGG